MPIAGDRPESGVRIALERPKDQAAPWKYAGFAHVPEASFPVSVTVADDGTVEVVLSLPASGEAPPGDLTEKIRLIVRTVYKQAKADDEAPPWRIVRWRGEK